MKSKSVDILVQNAICTGDEFLFISRLVVPAEINIFDFKSLRKSIFFYVILSPTIENTVETMIVSDDNTSLSVILSHCTYTLPPTAR